MEEGGDDFISRNTLVIIILVFVVFSLLGINLFYVSGNIFQNVTSVFGPAIGDFLSLLGYSTGTIINKSSEVVADTGHLGIDIADGTAHDIGNLFKDSANMVDFDKNLDNSINKKKYVETKDPEPTPTKRKEGMLDYSNI